jgi:hypothetical protein
MRTGFLGESHPKSAASGNLKAGCCRCHAPKLFPRSSADSASSLRAWNTDHFVHGSFRSPGTECECWECHYEGNPGKEAMTIRARKVFPVPCRWFMGTVAFRLGPRPTNKRFTFSASHIRPAYDSACCSRAVSYTGDSWG